MAIYICFLNIHRLSVSETGLQNVFWKIFYMFKKFFPRFYNSFSLYCKAYLNIFLSKKIFSDDKKKLSITITQQIYCFKLKFYYLTCRSC